MTIQITRPDVEALITLHLQNGKYSDAEDVVFQALQSLPPQTTATGRATAPAKDMVELFAPLRGLNIDFESDRSKDTGRDINL